MENDRFLLTLNENFLIKAEENEAGDKFLFLHASCEAEDEQKEVVLQKALQESVDYFLREGVVSYDHLFKSVDDNGRVKINPEYVIGEPVDVKFTNKHDNSTFVKARIYYDEDNSEALANSAYRLAKSKSSRLRASVGGRILERDKNNKNIIKRVLWDDIAITLKPVNKSLNGISVIPLEVFAKSFNGVLEMPDLQIDFSKIEMEKAMSFGYDLTDRIDRLAWEQLKKALEATSQVTDTNFSGGRALQAGGLGSPHRKQIFRKLAKGIMNGIISNRNDVDDFLVDNNIQINNEIKTHFYSELIKMLKKYKKK